LAREDDLGARAFRLHEPGLLQAVEVDGLARDAREVARAHFRGLHDEDGEEAALRQAPLQRHLAALEADLVVAAGARALALVAAPRGLAEARAAAAPDALARLVRSGRRLDRVEFHRHSPITFTRWLTLLIIP